MWQEIIVAIIGVAVALLVVMKIYRFFYTEKGEGDCGCSGCGCTTKQKHVKIKRRFG